MRALLVAALFFACFMAVVVMLERSFIYYPSRVVEPTPQDLGLAFDDVTLTTEDGVRLHAWYLPYKGSRGVVLVSHGNAGNIAHRLDRARILQRAVGLDVFLYDYRGFGRSEGSPHEAGTYADGRAAYQHLVGDRRVPPERLILFGESLGCAVTIELATTQRSAGLVLEAPFTSVRDMARAAFPLLPIGPFLRTRYDNLSKVGRLETPLLVLHGDRDRVVPFEQGQRVYAAAREPKRFYRIRGADHNDAYDTGGEAYWRELSDFVSEVLTRAERAIP